MHQDEDDKFRDDMRLHNGAYTNGYLQDGHVRIYRTLSLLYTIYKLRSETTEVHIWLQCMQCFILLVITPTKTLPLFPIPGPLPLSSTCLSPLFPIPAPILPTLTKHTQLKTCKL